MQDVHDYMYLFFYRNYIGTKWYGFTDSQSGIDFFVIRVGTARGSGDVISPTRLTETDQTFITDLPSLLPLNHRIFITIRAYNKAGRLDFYYSSS